MKKGARIHTVSQEEKFKVFLKTLFQQYFKDFSLPSKYNIELINKQFLAVFPDSFFFKSIAIISCTKIQSQRLTKCFINTEETLEIKEQLYKSLIDHSKNCFKNNEIINCVGNVISNLPKDFFITQYISLIKCFTKRMSKENETLCNLLVLFPSNYEELCSTINTKLNLANLPENPVDFYSRSKYHENIKNFEKNAEKKNDSQKEIFKESKDSPNEMFNFLKNELDKLKLDISKKDEEIKSIKLDSAKKDKENKSIKFDVSQKDKRINQLESDMKSIKLNASQKDERINQLESDNTKKNGKIMELENEVKKQKSDISSIEIKLKSTEYSLFQIQLRDIINEFIKEIKWSFALKSDGLNDIIYELEKILNEMVANQSYNNRYGANVIMDILKKCRNVKNQGNDSGHYINNIGFDEKILPEKIKNLYNQYKKKNNYLIKNCDSVALILSVKEINNTSEDNVTTNKKYKLFDNIFSLNKKDFNSRKQALKSLIINYV